MEEGQNIPIRILDLEAPQPVIDERKLFDERRPPLLELGEQCVGVLRVDVGSQRAQSCRVWFGRGSTSGRIV